MDTTIKPKRFIPPKRLTAERASDCIARIKEQLEASGESKTVNVRALAEAFVCQVDAIYDIYAKHATEIGLARLVDESPKKIKEKAGDRLLISERFGIQIPKRQLQKLNTQLESRNLPQYTAGDAFYVNICQNGSLIVSKKKETTE